MSFRLTAGGALAGVFVAVSPALAAHVHPIIIVTPARGGVMGPPGPEAELPLEVAGAAPEVMSGPFVTGVVLAQHTVVAREAVILTAPINTDGIEVPAGEALAKVVVRRTPDEPERALWCRTSPLPRLHQSRTDCFEDREHTGAFTRYTTAPLAVQDASFAVGWIDNGPGRVIPPTPYRPATAAERPSTRIGYGWCAQDSDGVKTPYRFASVIYQDGYGWLGPNRACPFGTWVDPADRHLLKVDRVDVKVEDGADGPRFTVLDRIPPGPIAGFRAGEPIRSSDTPSVAEVERTQARRRGRWRRPAWRRGSPRACAVTAR